MGLITLLIWTSLNILLSDKGLRQVGKSELFLQIEELESDLYNQQATTGNLESDINSYRDKLVSHRLGSLTVGFACLYLIFARPLATVCIQAAAKS